MERRKLLQTLERIRLEVHDINMKVDHLIENLHDLWRR